MMSSSVSPLLIDDHANYSSMSPSTTDHSLPHTVSAGKCTSSQPRSPAAATIIAATAASREAELHRTPAPDRGRGQIPPLNTPSLFRRASVAGKISSRRLAAF